MTHFLNRDKKIFLHISQQQVMSAKKYCTLCVESFLELYNKMHITNNLYFFVAEQNEQPVRVNKWQKGESKAVELNKKIQERRAQDKSQMTKSKSHF